MLDLSDFTFLIPFKGDGGDRDVNLGIVMQYIAYHFNTSVLIVEQGSVKTKIPQVGPNVKLQHEICASDYADRIHKTRLFNIGLSKVKTSNVICYDADVLIPPNQIYLAASQMSSGKADYCYPFKDGYIEVIKQPEHYRSNLLSNYDFAAYAREMTKHRYRNSVTLPQSIDTMKQRYRFFKDGRKAGISQERLAMQSRPQSYKASQIFKPTPPGGCIFIATKVYIDIGMENEDFIGYAPEDIEKKCRLEKLGYRAGNVAGYLYHLEHSISHKRLCPDEYLKLFEKIKNMSREDVIAYYKDKNYASKYGVA